MRVARDDGVLGGIISPPIPNDRCLRLGLANKKECIRGRSSSAPAH